MQPSGGLYLLIAKHQQPAKSIWGFQPKWSAVDATLQSIVSAAHHVFDAA
jgi:hypothetical protein